MKDISNTCIYLYLRIPARSPVPTHKWHRGATNPPGSPDPCSLVVGSSPRRKPDKPSIQQSIWGPGGSSRRSAGVGDLRRRPVGAARVNFCACANASVPLSDYCPPRLTDFRGGVDPPVGVGPRLHRSDVGTEEELLSVAPRLLIRKVIFHVGWDRCARHLLQHDCLQEPQHEKLVYANATRLRRLIVIDGDIQFRPCVRPQATRRPHLTCISCILNIRRSATKDRILHLRSPRLFRGKRDVVVAWVRAAKAWVCSRPVMLESKRRKPEASTHVCHIISMIRRVLPNVVEIEVAGLRPCSVQW